MSVVPSAGDGLGDGDGDGDGDGLGDEDGLDDGDGDGDVLGDGDGDVLGDGDAPGDALGSVAVQCVASVKYIAVVQLRNTSPVKSSTQFRKMSYSPATIGLPRNWLIASMVLLNSTENGPVKEILAPSVFTTVPSKPFGPFTRPL